MNEHKDLTPRVGGSQRDGFCDDASERQTHYLVCTTKLIAEYILFQYLVFLTFYDSLIKVFNHSSSTIIVVNYDNNLNYALSFTTQST